ncbi:MAG TPA: hypothetical protein VGM19_05375 [Armatimonadota bacterium]|jgi:hypothetical protein
MSRNLLRLPLVLCLLVLIGLAPVLAQEAAAPLLTLNQMLTAALQPADLAGLLDSPEAWWPRFPEFNTPAICGPMRPGERYYVAQNYAKVSDPARERLEVTVDLYDTPKQAHRAFVDLSSENALGSAVKGGAKIGNERRYFIRRGPLNETVVRYRVGVVIGRISFFTPGAPASLETVTKAGEIVTGRVSQLLAGTLNSPTLPEDFAKLMPPNAATAEIGNVAGAAVVPSQAWALTDTLRAPEKVYDLLKTGGAPEMYFQRYEAKGLPGNVVDAVLWKFSDADAAKRWVRQYINQVRVHRPFYDPGDTGVYRAFAFFPESQIYELQFAKGRLAADVSGLAPFAAQTDPRVQPLVRRLSELWYNALPLS